MYQKQIVGLVISSIGLILIGIASTSNRISSIPLEALIITLGAPIAWAALNIIARSASNRVEAKGEN